MELKLGDEQLTATVVFYHYKSTKDVLSGHKVLLDMVNLFRVRQMTVCEITCVAGEGVGVSYCYRYDAPNNTIGDKRAFEVATRGFSKDFRSAMWKAYLEVRPESKKNPKAEAKTTGNPILDAINRMTKQVISGGRAIASPWTINLLEGGK